MKVRFLASKPWWIGSPPAGSRLIVSYLVVSTVTSLLTPFRHQIVLTFLAWLLLWLYLVARCRRWGSGLEEDRRRAGHLVGLLFALSTICERAAGSEASIVATRPILPLVAYLVTRAIDIASLSSCDRATGATSHKLPLWLQKRTASHVSIAFLGVAAAGSSYFTPPEFILGVVAVILRAVAIVTLERIRDLLSDEKLLHGAGSVHLWDRPPPTIEETNTPEAMHLELLKTMALPAALCSAAGSLFVESTPSVDEILSFISNNRFTFGTEHILWLGTVISPVVGATSAFLLFRVIVERGALIAGTVDVGSVFTTNALRDPSVWNICLLMLYSIASASSLMIDAPASLDGFETTQVNGIAVWLGPALLVLGVTILGLSLLSTTRVFDSARFDSMSIEIGTGTMNHLHGFHNGSGTGSHPVELLVDAAKAGQKNVIARQSRNLRDAVTEYRRRYGVHPPPKFDVWFEFAKSKGALLVDEFDTLHDSLLPFWAFSPRTLRTRVNEAFGYGDNGLMVFMIRDGRISLMEGSTEWLRNALTEMTSGFIEHLPDMDVAFNIHDEPRVTIPHSELSRMVQMARTTSLPEVLAHKRPRNAFSSRPSDMTNGKQYKDYSTTRFNKFSHQPTWSHARLSCPPDSPARDIFEQASDNRSAYALEELGFVYNQSAFSDICNSPSLRDTYGFFDRPNMFIPTQDLVPVFSQSKLSSFQDIVYPSPWYWADKVKYEDKEDTSWEDKNRTLYWRGSTTGGYSRHGGWRRHHRQHCVQQINSRNSASIFTSPDENEHAVFERRLTTVPRNDFADAIDVKFSHVGQCDEGDCHAQREFFHVVEREKQDSAWGARYLLDMDGNAFSGRFLAFLRSRSLVFKMALFREWHADWLRPWLHYIPLSLAGDEWLEVVRFFDREEHGQQLAKALALESRDWANRAMRKEDMEVWFFRLLLEYGRLLDDDRAVIGFRGH